MSYYLFARLSNMPPTWTLAVLATSAAMCVPPGVLVAIMLMNPISST